MKMATMKMLRKRMKNRMLKVSYDVETDTAYIRM